MGQIRSGMARQATPPFDPAAAGGSKEPIRRGSRSAVSILELIVALALGMVLSVLGFSAFSLFKRQAPVQSSSNGLSQALSTARSLAVSRNSRFQVTLDLDRAHFWIDEITSAGIANVTRPKIVRPELIEKRTRIEGVLQGGSVTAETTGRQFFIFNPDGSAEREARIFFILKADDPADNTKITTVRLYGPTGLNRVFAGQRI